MPQKLACSSELRGFLSQHCHAFAGRDMDHRNRMCITKPNLTLRLIHTKLKSSKCEIDFLKFYFFFSQPSRWLQKALASRSDVAADDASRKGTASASTSTSSQKINMIDVLAEVNLGVIFSEFRQIQEKIDEDSFL